MITKIDGWQNKGESLKISIRTDEAHTQMVEDGVYRNGAFRMGTKKYYQAAMQKEIPISINNFTT